MAKRKYDYIGVYTNKSDATGYGSKMQTEAMAMLISHPGVGVGRKVCVYREPATGTRHAHRARTLVSCWVKGNKIKKKAKR